MKVLVINGSPKQHGCTDTALSEVEAQLHREGIETERHWVGRQPVPGCLGCNHCAEAGKCVFHDGVNELAARVDEFDALVVGSPVYYAGPSGQIHCFLDRLFYVTGSTWAGKPGAAVVSCRRGGASSAFDQLNKYFTISNMPVVPSQYWNQVHGNTPEEVLQDAEGLQMMRTLGENMAWLLRSIEAGKKAVVPAPQYEPKVATNYIR